MIERLRQFLSPHQATSRPANSALPSSRAAVMAILFGVAACNQDSKENTAETCPVDPNTSAMQYSWAKAEAYQGTCTLEAAVDAEQCEEDGGTTAECNDQRDSDEETCQYIFMKQVNKLPLRECGEPIFDIAGEGPGDSHYGWEVNSDDFDGDGVHAYYEFLMGSNPCSVYSFPSGEECISDGELDYDADGIPNGKDAAPLCNQDDPGEYSSDCA